MTWGVCDNGPLFMEREANMDSFDEPYAPYFHIHLPIIHELSVFHSIQFFQSGLSDTHQRRPFLDYSECVWYTHGFSDRVF